MLVSLVKYLTKYYFGLNIVFYPTFRALGSLITALLISLLTGPYIINFLRKFSLKQNIRNFALKSHAKKCNTPTMGGIIIILSMATSIMMWTYLSNPYVWCILFVLLSYGIIGFIDDYRKVICKNTKGLLAIWKYLWMSLVALIVIFWLYLKNKDTLYTELVIPFFSNTIAQQKLGIFYIFLSYFVIVGTGNAVNLTDGLDGLAIVPTIFVAGGLTVVSWITGNISFANHLHIPYLYYAVELMIVCTSIIGAGLGFLWFNTYPAQVFMGDVGSITLGGTLGIIAVLLRQQFLLLIMGGLFVIETLSVILQVCSFKLSGHRIFLMAPIHHHYELKGWPEPRVTVRFWIISIILVIISLEIFKVRQLW